jgi:hypothetical protein
VNAIHALYQLSYDPVAIGEAGGIKQAGVAQPKKRARVARLSLF